MNYKPVIGIEVHVELNTKSKMFCRCSADYFGKEPNTHTCPVCLGLPGALPYTNEEAIKKCIQIGLALNCKISETSLFERKNYFYPDLPKGYQISQYRWPLCIEGWLEISKAFLLTKGREVEGSKERRIRINRVHQEEDTGKLTHAGKETLIDFNRSGVPLVEIVTEPDFSSSEEVREYAKKLQQIFRSLGVSNADMEKGDMRLEANVSLREISNVKSQMSNGELPNYRVELKNINSFRFMVAAIEYEIKRQTEALKRGERLTQETRGWDEDKKCTYLQRSKEEAHDYRYFPEPDLPGIFFDKEKIDQIKKSLSELPNIRIKRFEEDYGINKTQAKMLVEKSGLAEYFERVMEVGKSWGIQVNQVVNYLINRKINTIKVSPEEVIAEIHDKDVGIIGDIGQLEELAKQAIKENTKAVEDFRNGKANAMQVLVGGVMKLSKGKAEPKKVLEILSKLLNN
ncbi:MAG: Asp-tRNA(Asn)/Glu-tRNA(Gln) amidotransferase subunit GatB [Patescibacteria group bacterium]